MSDKKDEINKKNEQDWSKVERTLNLVDYVYDKYENVPVTDEMLDDLYNFAMMKSRAGKADRDDVDLVDADDVDLFVSLDLETESPTTLVPSSTPVLRSIAPTHADLLPPHKKFRDSYSHKDSSKEHIEIGMGVEIAARDVIKTVAEEEESVGSHLPRVILFDVIPAIIPVIPEVPAEVPIVLDDRLVTPEDSLPPAPELPLVSPFLCSDDSKPDSESEPADQRPERHESLSIHDDMLTKWRDRDTSRLSSPLGSSSLDIFAPSSAHCPCCPHSGFIDGQRFLSDPGTLAWRSIPRCLSDCHSSPDFTSDSSSSGSSLDSSSYTSSGSPSDSSLDTPSVHSSRCDASSQTHSGPSTRVASSRLVYPLVMTLRYSEAFSRWRSVPFSTPYPSMTSESSLYSFFERSLDLSSLSAGPSCKRCRSPTTLVPSSTPVLRSIAPTHADLLPPHKKFRDSYLHEDSSKEHIEIGMGVKIAARDVIKTVAEEEVKSSARGTVEVEVDPRVGPVFDEDVPDHVTADRAIVVTYELFRDLVQRFHDHTKEIPVHQIQVIETAQRQLKAGQLMASGERAGLTDRIRRLGRENLKVQALLCIKRDRVGILCHHMALSQEEFRQIRRVHDDARRRLKRLKSFVERQLISQQVAEALANYEVTCSANALEAKSQSQNGNDGENENGNRNHGDGGNKGSRNLNENGRGAMPVARVCTYQDFVKCQPLNFKGTEEVVGLTRWFEKMETVFHISNCPEVYQV
nr:hypothetical protein [Tanacetum cinerariifolium]